MRRDRRARLGENTLTVEVIVGAQHMAAPIVQAKSKLSVVVLDGSDLGPLRSPSPAWATSETISAPSASRRRAV